MYDIISENIVRYTGQKVKIMEIKRCCFAGHRDIHDIMIKNRIKMLASDLIENCNVKKFLLGNYGNFDNYAFMAIQELKKEYNDIAIELIIPYITKSIRDYKEMYYRNYDEIVMADIPVNTPAKYKIIKANEYMIDNSEYLICCVNRWWGGAFRTVEYARKKGHIEILYIN